MLRRWLPSRWNRIFDSTVIVLATIGALSLVNWTVNRRYPVTVHLRVINIDDVKVPAGGTFMYETIFTRSKACDMHIERWFVTSGSEVHQIETLNRSMLASGIGVRQSSITLVPVPSAMPVGPAKFCFKPHWECTPVQKFWPIQGQITCLGFLVDPPIAGLPPANDTTNQLAIESVF